MERPTQDHIRVDYGHHPNRRGVGRYVVCVHLMEAGQPPFNLLRTKDLDQALRIANSLGLPVIDKTAAAI